MMVVLAAVGLVLGGITWIARRDEDFHNVFVENRSGQRIAWLRIQTIRGMTGFPDLPDGEVAKMYFAFRVPGPGEDDFVVTGRLGDGTVLDGVFGITMDGSIEDRAHFVIGPGGTIDFWPGR